MKNNKRLLKAANKRVKKMNQRRACFGFKIVMGLLWAIAAAFGVIILKQKGIL